MTQQEKEQKEEDGKKWDQRASWLHTGVCSSSGKGILAQEKQFHICPHHAPTSISFATRNKAQLLCLCCMSCGNLVCKRSAFDGMWGVLVVTASILSSALLLFCYVREGSCKLGLCNRRKRCSYQGSSSPTVTPRLHFNCPECPPFPHLFLQHIGTLISISHIAKRSLVLVSL